MSNEANPTSPAKSHRLWVPFMASGIFLLSILIAFFLPEDYAPFVRTSVVFGGTLLGLIVSALWWVFFSRFTWRVRIRGILAILTLRYGLIREIDYSGDVVPIPVWRWEQAREQRIVEHRATQQPGQLAKIDATIGANDYPNYRNRNLDAVATGPKLWTNWKDRAPRKVWSQPCGAGYSGFAIAGNSIFTLEQRGPLEMAVAYDRDTGRERWTHSWVARHFDALGGEGPMTTPTVIDGMVFILGGTGHFACLDAVTGKPLWEKDLLEDNKNLQWGMSCSPIPYKDMVIVHPGEQAGKQLNRAIRAYDRKSGNLVWQTGNQKTGYCTPMIVNLLDTTMLLAFDAVEIMGLNPDNGEKLWSFPWVTNQGINVAQPIPLGSGKLFITSSYGVGCGLLQLTKSGADIQAKELWHNFQLRCRFNSPVHHNQFIYGLDEGALVCLDPVSGRRKWKGNRYGQGQILRQDDTILIQAENGDLAIVRADPESFQELGRFKALSGEKTWNCPALSNGFAFIRNHNEMACYDLRHP